jgi:hypothetical protein
MGGVLYLIIIIAGMFGEAFRGGFASGDAATKAATMMSMESLWRFGIAGELFMLSFCAVPLALIFFVLLRPVNRDLALLAVFFNLVSIALEAANKLHLLRSVFPLGNAESLGDFEPEQLLAMATLSVRSHDQGFVVSLIFFACECLVLGYLMARSGYMPKAIGVLMQIAGLCYLTNSFGLLLDPGLDSGIFSFVLLPVFVAEWSLCVWLLAKGIDTEKWNRARAHDSIEVWRPQPGAGPRTPAMA